MAWFDTNKGYKTYGGNGDPKQGHRPVILGPEGLPRYHRATSPPPRVHYSYPYDYGKFKNPSDDENDYIQKDHGGQRTCNKGGYQTYNHGGQRTSNNPKILWHYDEGSLQYGAFGKAKSPNDNENDYSSDDDIVCEDRVCYKKNALNEQVYDKENHKGYGKGLLQYGAVHQPQYNGLPQKDHGGQATIDRTEVSRRYDKGLPQYGAYGEQQNYNIKTIDCIEAAKKYRGVLMAK